MTMSSRDLFTAIAHDFAMALNERFGFEDSADMFFDSVEEVFGDAPTRESMLEGLNSDGARRLASELNDYLEIDTVTERLAKQLIQMTIVNNFGEDALA